MISRYRSIYGGSNVIEVEAVQLTKENVHELAYWCDGQEVLEHDALDAEKTFVGINFQASGGRRRVSEGDFIIKSIENGDFYAHTPNTFNRMYELITGNS